MMFASAQVSEAMTSQLTAETSGWGCHPWSRGLDTGTLCAADWPDVQQAHSLQGQSCGLAGLGCFLLRS